MALRRGDPHSGVIFLKSAARDGQAILYAQTRDMNGDRGWRQAAGPAPEAEIDARIERERQIDSDLWAIEVMDDAMGHPLNPPLIADGV